MCLSTNESSPGGKSCRRAEAEAEQDALFDPCVDAPAGGGGGVGRSGAEFAPLERVAEGEEGIHGGGISDGGSAGGKMALDGLFKLGGIHFVMSLTWEPSEQFIDGQRSASTRRKEGHSTSLRMAVFGEVFAFPPMSQSRVMDGALRIVRLRGKNKVLRLRRMTGLWWIGVGSHPCRGKTASWMGHLRSLLLHLWLVLLSYARSSRLFRRRRPGAPCCEGEAPWK